MEFFHATKGNAHPGDKPRVYFTCHPEDFERYFKQTCDALFAANDCAVYYSEDMSAPLDDANDQAVLERMQLFVIPVTFRLLSKPNRALDHDLRFALAHNIPVLPLMMEPELDELYASPEAFGELQYIMPGSQDVTEISFQDKLRNYLDSVLISPELAERIRKAFDAYIFLSYRKKDRAHANKLMRIIHDNPECRDVAIWFDEFLTPGESFTESIGHALEKSELFTLLVTPNVLEKPDGKPNFVMGEEYPAAKDSGKDILAAMMVDTDEAELKASFAGIPACVNPHDEEDFRERFLAALQRVAVAENDDDPEHNYLIGLAYLEGIDVERHPERALGLIVKAAERGLPEALEKLVTMYEMGDGVPLDKERETFWAERLLARCRELYGEENPRTLERARGLAKAYGNLERHQEAYELDARTYEIQRRVLGEEDPETLITQVQLAMDLRELGDALEAVRVLQEACQAMLRVYGEGHQHTLAAYMNLAVLYGEIGEHERALELQQSMSPLICSAFGAPSMVSLQALANIGDTWRYLRNDQAAIALFEEAYAGVAELEKGELGMSTMFVQSFVPRLLFAWGGALYELGRLDEALERFEEAYQRLRETAEEDSPVAWAYMQTLAAFYDEAGEHRKSLEWLEALYGAKARVLGEAHEEALELLTSMAFVRFELEEFEEGAKLLERVYEAKREALGDYDVETWDALTKYALALDEIGDTTKAAELLQRCYEKVMELYGEEAPYAQYCREMLEEIASRATGTTAP